MEFRLALESDVASIMSIIKQAQSYFKEQRINQWQNGYPNPEVIMNDIRKKYSYVLVKEDKVVGTVAVSFDGEKTYDFIFNGDWLSHQAYAVIHRMAVDAQLKGLGLSSIIMKKIEEMCLNKGVHSIKIDTHQENKSMQKLLQKNGFQYCGIIHLLDKSERLAFEKILL
ncbi:GNAT family N-acetyltransferase [Bacillus sp. BRMEA1]|uniref:GNAT family N-acetyltransferase n=1 Tax=Neobacillus endophyticus TaxID=2738405 RepID=UPI001563B50B|nr:GNAT family N-acetyltransferase [Neobacillus endophyticus]NRD80062.1 GNAT family N-acetyltransferase [Neobacillus endophyticus]